MNDATETPTSETESPPNAKARSRSNRLITAMILLLTSPAIIANLLSYFGAWRWEMDMFSHFRVQFTAALTLAAIALLLLRHYKIALLPAIVIVINLTTIIPLYIHPNPVSTVDQSMQPQLKILHFNIENRYSNHPAIISYLDQSAADIIFVQEATNNFLRLAQSKLANYEIPVARPRDDSFGLIMLIRKASQSSITLIRTEILDLSNGRFPVPAIESIITFDGRELAILSLHTAPPTNGKATRIRNDMLTTAGLWATHLQQHPTILIGDFNATPWSNGMQSLIDDTGLINSQRGFGIQPTWPQAKGLGKLAGKIPIDHCLHSRELTTVNRQIGPALGSDHNPVQVTLQWVK